MLRVGVGDGFQPAEDDGVVGYDEGGLAADCFVDDGTGDVDGEEEAVVGEGGGEVCAGGGLEKDWVGVRRGK